MLLCVSLEFAGYVSVNFVTGVKYRGLKKQAGNFSIRLRIKTERSLNLRREVDVNGND